MNRVANDLDRITKISPESCMKIVEFVVGRLNEAAPNAQGTGCVIAAGGRYLVPAYAAVRKLREHGWDHDIQIWHISPREVDERARSKFSEWDVEFVDALLVSKERQDMRKLGGWTCKGYAVKHCPYEHVLLLDADSFPQRDPSCIFRTWQYQQHGLVLAPDIQRNRPNDQIFPMLRLKVPEAYIEAEAGQIWCNKLKNWKAIQLMNWINSHSDFFYKFFHGDKETWPLAWMKLGMPFDMLPSCDWINDGMLHYGFDRLPITHHACHQKRGGTFTPDIQEIIQEYAQ